MEQDDKLTTAEVIAILVNDIEAAKVAFDGAGNDVQRGFAVAMLEMKCGQIVKQTAKLVSGSNGISRSIDAEICQHLEDTADAILNASVTIVERLMTDSGHVHPLVVQGAVNVRKLADGILEDVRKIVERNV